MKTEEGRKNMVNPSITVGDEREEVVIRRLDDGKVVLVVGGQ